MEPTPQSLIEDIIRQVNRGFCPRIRIAVSPEEYNTIREYCLNHYGSFSGRLLDLPLIIEDAAPELFVEYP